MTVILTRNSTRRQDATGETMTMMTKKSFSQGQRGFTAIEIAMVATVIALFALLVLPLFRNRVEEAKLAKAAADLASMQKALTLAKADTAFYPRLEDLDNVELNLPPTPPAGGVNLEIPPFYFRQEVPANRRGLSPTEWANYAGTASAPKWRGAYLTFPKSLTLSEIRTGPQGNVLCRSLTGNNSSPIWDVTTGFNGGPVDSLENRYPIDPWGSPYLFYPATGETIYNPLNANYASYVYSLGPDGLPGDPAVGPKTALDYIPGGTVTGIGTANSDEARLNLKVQF